MYSDPSLIRDNVVKIRLNDPESELIDAWVKYTGQQKAALLRDMLLEQARLDMGMESASVSAVAEGPQRSLFNP